MFLVAVYRDYLSFLEVLWFGEFLFWVRCFADFLCVYKC